MEPCRHDPPSVLVMRCHSTFPLAWAGLQYDLPIYGFTSFLLQPFEYIIYYRLYEGFHLSRIILGRERYLLQILRPPFGAHCSYLRHYVPVVLGVLRNELLLPHAHVTRPEMV